MNPFTGKEYSEEAKRLRLENSTLPAADPIVLKKLEELYKTCDVLLIKAETGAGKGVIIAPKIAELTLPGRVVVTEPRTVNTHVADFLKKVMDTNDVAYGYRFANNIRDTTRLAFVTDGYLLNFFYRDPELPDYDAIIIDETHERNKNIDQLLAFCKRVAGRKKIALMSATIDLNLYEKYFAGAKIGKLEISGRAYPVEHVFIASEEDYVAQAVKLVISDIFPPGDILIFLNSESELRKACREIHAKTKFTCYELHKGTQAEMREEIIAKNQKPIRKIVFSTNIAESGITIDGITIVIDCGRRYESIFRPADEMYEMELTFISRAEIQQRSGRAGRTAPGICYHLYSEEDYKRMPEYKAPEIEKEEISDVVLQISAQMGSLEFLRELPSPPAPEKVSFATRLLCASGLLDESLKITPLGREVVNLPLSPQEAVCLLKAKFLRVEGAVCKILAMISIEPMIERWFQTVHENSPHFKEYKKKLHSWENASGEVFAMKHIFDKYLDAGDRARDWCSKNFLQGSKLAQAKKQFFKLLGKAKDLKDVSFFRGAEGEITESEKKKIQLALCEGFKLNVITRVGESGSNKYVIQRPCKTVIVTKTPFIKKLSKRMLFLDVKKISGQAKVSSLVNL